MFHFCLFISNISISNGSTCLGFTSMNNWTQTNFIIVNFYSILPLNVHHWVYEAPGASQSESSISPVLDIQQTWCWDTSGADRSIHPESSWQHCDEQRWLSLVWRVPLLTEATEYSHHPSTHCWMMKQTSDVPHTGLLPAERPLWEHPYWESYCMNRQGSRSLK